MEKFKNLSRHDLQQALPPNQLRITQIMVVAILLGSVLLLIPIAVINSTKPVPLVAEPLSTFVQQFMLGVLGFAVLAYGFIYFFPAIFFSADAVIKRLRSTGSAGDSSQAADFLINMDRQFRIIINAMFESVSVLAAVGIFLEMSYSEYQLSGDIWLLLMPIAIHAIFVFLNFPTKENILNRIERDILQKIRNHHTV